MAELALDAADDRAALLAKTARLEAQARATLEITTAICSVPVLDELLTLIAQRCRELLRCEVAGFALLEDQSKTIVWRAMCGCTTETYRHVTYADSAGVAGRAISSGRPVVVHDFLTDGGIDPHEFPISFAEGLRSALGVPLEIDKRPRGCLMIGYRHVHDFVRDEIDTLTSFSLQAAIAVENAQLYERIRGEQARLESVVQSINEGLLLVSLSERIVYANRQAETLLRTPVTTLIGEPCEAFFERLCAETTHRARTQSGLAELRTSALDFPTFDVEFATPPAVVLRLTRFDVYDSGSEHSGFGYLCRDITFEKQVDAMKTEVISLVSHEIKTPLASIRGYASALLDRSRQRDRALELDYLHMIDTESARLDELVCNLTDVSKLDAGVLFLEKHEIGPAYLLRSVLARWRKGTPERRFRVTCDDRIAPLPLDRRRIAQVFDNLIGNAVKYSQPGSIIAAAARQDGASVTFSISDRGSGIPRAERDRVFERFYRRQAQRHERHGSGLGLFIARGIVAAHGGEIWIDSTAGEGTTVAFSLPIEARVG